VGHKRSFCDPTGMSASGGRADVISPKTDIADGMSAVRGIAEVLAYSSEGPLLATSGSSVSFIHTFAITRTSSNDLVQQRFARWCGRGKRVAQASPRHSKKKLARQVRRGVPASPGGDGGGNTLPRHPGQPRRTCPVDDRFASSAGVLAPMVRGCAATWVL
jgi:hypothetical protein